MKTPEIDAAVKSIESGDRQPLYLVIGEQVLATREATRIAEALGAAAGCEVAIHKGAAGAELRSILADLLTFSLFEPAKVALVVASEAFADKDAAADLVDEAAKALGDDYGLAGAAREGLSLTERRAAGLLLQTLRLFDVDPLTGGAEEAVSALPDSALSGGKNLRTGGRRGRLKKERAELARGLAALLEAARAEGLSGWSDKDVAELARVAGGGLPEGHALVFAERSVDRGHPIARRLFERDAAFEVGQLGFDRNGNVVGLHPVVAELERETGVRIDRAGSVELARRTLRKGGGWGASEADASSAARFAAEYRKLAAGARGGSERIDRGMVVEMVSDRGEEDVWKVLDAIGRSGPARALVQFRRYLATAADQDGATFSFFGVLGGFCQHLVAIHGAIARNPVPPVRDYNAFRSRVLPKIKADLPESVAKIAPFRLFRAYQAATLRQGPEAERLMADLPWKVLETEVRLKGGSDDRTTAIEALVATLAGGVASTAARSSSARGRSGRSGLSRRTGPSGGWPAARR